MLQKKHFISVLCLLLSFLAVGAYTSCSEYNSESVGSTFFPSNSQVRNFTHPVYVEFSQEEAPRVWGPFLQDVDVSTDGQHVSLKNTSDSLALFVYGYQAMDGVSSSNNSLTIESNKNYALYINKLQLSSTDRPAISSTGTGICYMVIPKGSKNQLTTEAAPSTFAHNGTLIITGEGELALTNLASAEQHPVALSVRGGLHCQYAAKLNISCYEGDAMRINEGPFRSSLGTWTFDAGQHAISNPDDSIVLIAGTYSGVARDGKFFDNSIGAVIRQASVQGLAGQASDLLDTLIMRQHYDSTLISLQQHFDSLIVQADSTLTIARKGQTSKLADFKPRYEMKAPWVLVADKSLSASDTLTVVKK